MIGRPAYEELEKKIQALELEIETMRSAEISFKEESRYPTLFEAAYDSIFILKDYKFVECNKMTLKIFGCEKEEDILGFYPWDFSPVKQPDGSLSKSKSIEMMEAALSGVPQRFYWRHIQKNGIEFDAEIALNYLETENNNSLQAIVRDISAFKKVERALKENENKYRTLFDMESDAIALIEIETGNMLEVNKAFVDLYGYSREEILRMKNTDFSAEPDLTKQATREHGIYVPIRYHKKKDGTVFVTEITANIFEYQGRHVHIAAIRDITERRRLEAQLQRSLKMETMGLLAGGVAHDLNNVLSGIVSYPELILLQLPEESTFRKPIEAIHRAGLRAVAIVEDLLTIARGVAISKESMNLNDLITDYLESPEFQTLQQFHPAVKIYPDLDPGLFNLLGSYVHIRKALMNLVSNASEAIENVGMVAIKTKNRYIDKPLKGYNDVNVGEYVVLEVTDNGSGISSGEIDRIFEPFYTKKVLGRSGTGLGLAVVWNVVQDHKGYIDVKSEGKGTTFELYFPITRNAISEKSIPKSINEYRGNGETILIVDDVESQREIACKIMEVLGYLPKVVSSGEEALNYLYGHKVDLVLLDMIMSPGINGRETYERMIKIRPGQRAIIVSGYSETVDVKETIRLGAGQYIKKPYTLEKIGLAIKDALNNNGN